MVMFNTDLERNLTIVVSVLACIVVIMAIVWGATWPINDDDKIIIPVTCPLTQFFTVNHIPVLPGNLRDLKIFYPISFQNIPQHVIFEILPETQTVVPPISLRPVINGNEVSEVIAYRNDNLNFALTTLVGDATNVFIGTSSSPENLGQNTGRWVCIKCTNNSMTVAFGIVQSTVDILSWETPTVIANITAPFIKASGPVLAIGYSNFAWFGVDGDNKQQLEIIDTSTSTLVRTAIGPLVDEESVNILGFQNLSLGSRVIVVWPSQAVSYHFNNNVWNVNIFWTNTGTETCLGGALTYDSSLYDVVLMIQDGTSATYVNFTHVVSKQDNIWIRKGEITAPISSINAPGCLFMTKAANNGDFFIYTCYANIIYITRTQSWKIIENFNTPISTDINEIIVIAKADLFGIDDSICITYRSSGSILGVNTVGILSFYNTSDNQEIVVMSNARKEIFTEKMDLSVSTVFGIDSLVLYTPIDTADFSGISQSFPLVATVNVNVLVVQ
jgi:hypothetical protein